MKEVKTKRVTILGGPRDGEELEVKYTDFYIDICVPDRVLHVNDMDDFTSINYTMHQLPVVETKHGLVAMWNERK